jgi:hypothetical protein
LETGEMRETGVPKIQKEIALLSPFSLVDPLTNESQRDGERR